jgi:glycosyltransferase involved in cell wall biosynthesis
MKIVFTSIFRPDLGGGAGRVAHELAHQFAPEHDVVMICPADETGYEKREEGLSVFGIRSAGDDEFHMPDLSARTVGEVFDFLNEYQPDIVHAHDPALIGLIGQVWARMNFVPFVHTAHILPSKALDFGTADALNVWLLKNSLSESVIQSVLNNFYMNCDALIALNQSALESIREFGFQGSIFVVPNGRDLKHYSQCKNADNTIDQKSLVFIGFMNKRKNQAYLLEMLKELPANYILRLIGKPLTPEYLNELEEYCREHNLKNVDFVGQIGHDQIPDYLEGALVFPSASKMEVQSLVVIEALASGTPVVGLSNETIDELVNDKVGARLAKDKEPGDFAKQIERICNLPADEYQAMCQTARKSVAHLDWSNIVYSTAEAYRKILKTKPTRSDDESDMLTSLVSFLAMGDVKDYLLDAIEETRQSSGAEANLLPRVKVPSAIKSWIRVPSSTWLISGFTILISAFGYLFMKGRGKKKK